MRSNSALLFLRFCTACVGWTLQLNKPCSQPVQLRQLRQGMPTTPDRLPSVGERGADCIHSASKTSDLRESHRSSWRRLGGPDPRTPLDAAAPEQRSTLSKQHSTLLTKTATMSNEFIIKFSPLGKVKCCFDIVAVFGNNVERNCVLSIKSKQIEHIQSYSGPVQKIFTS